MIRWSDAKCASRLAALFLVAALPSACGGPNQALQDLPEALRGKIRIVAVEVQSRRGVASPEIASALRQALVEALEEEPEAGQALDLVVVIEDYLGLQGQAGGARTSGLGGAKSRLQGRVYLVDRKNGAALAEFRPLAQIEPGDLDGSGSADGSSDVRRALIDRFVAAVIEEIS